MRYYKNANLSLANIIFFLKPFITIITILLANKLYGFLQPFNVFAIWFILSLGYSINIPFLIISVLIIICLGWLICPVLLCFKKTFNKAKILLYILLFIELLSIALSLIGGDFSFRKIIAMLFNIIIFVILKNRNTGRNTGDGSVS